MPAEDEAFGRASRLRLASLRRSSRTLSFSELGLTRLFAQARSNPPEIPRLRLRTPRLGPAMGSVESKAPHHFDLILGHRPGRILDVAFPPVRLARIAITPEVRQNHGEVASQRPGNLVPGHMGFRVTVEQKQRRPFAPNRRVDQSASRRVEL